MQVLRKTINQITTFSRVLVFALGIVLKSGIWIFIAVFSSSFLLGLRPAVAVYVEMKIVNEIVALLGDAEAIGDTKIWLWLVLRLMVSLAALLLDNFNEIFIYIQGKRVTRLMNSQMLKKITTLNMAVLDESDTYDRIERASSESSLKPVDIIIKINRIIRHIITFIALGIIVATFSKALLVTMLFVCLPLLTVMIRYAKKQYRIEYDRTEDLRKANYLYDTLTRRNCITEIRSYRLTSYLIDKWYTTLIHFDEQDIALRKRQNIAEFSAHAILISSDIGALFYIVYVALTSRFLNVGSVLMVSRSFTNGLSSLRMIVETFTNTVSDLMYLNNCLELKQIKPTMRIDKSIKPIPGDIHSIEFKNVSFKYPGTKKVVLNEVNFVLERGKITLLIGENGAGKTTIIRLLMRLYDPDTGVILLNGVDIKEYNLQQLRGAIGILFQDYIRYWLPASENIGVGCIDRVRSISHIIESAKKGNALRFIKLLPNGFQTIMSPEFSNGVEISGGQWQRLALARFFMKDSPVMILDEPDANLDIDAQRGLVKRLKEMSKDRICLVISHRLAEKCVVDRVIDMKHGRVIDEDIHETVLPMKGECLGYREKDLEYIQIKKSSGLVTAT